MTKPYIICVDDDKSILVSLKFQLQYEFGERFEFETAESAIEAWEVINDLLEQGEKIAVIVSDYIMPITKGDEFLTSVHNEYPDITKIILTGHADPQAIEVLQRNISLDGYFSKPWNIDDIVNVINKHNKNT